MISIYLGEYRGGQKKKKTVWPKINVMMVFQNLFYVAFWATRTANKILKMCSLQ